MKFDQSIKTGDTHEKYIRPARILARENAGACRWNGDSSKLSGRRELGTTSECYTRPRIERGQASRTWRRDKTPAYYRPVEAWHRWARRFAPPVFLAHFGTGYNPVPNATSPAMRLLWSQSDVPFEAARHAISGYAPMTAKCFWEHFPAGYQPDYPMHLVIQGESFRVVGQQRIRLIAELNLLMMIAGNDFSRADAIAAIRSDMEAMI